MEPFGIGLPVICPEHDVVHLSSNATCRDCGHAVCAQCMGCNCDKALCDCAYSRG